jgi:hypothetical protein
MQGLLFYDPTVGEGEFYTTNGRGGIGRTRLHVGWRRGWTRIVPGSFGGDGFTDLLFYEPAQARASSTPQTVAGASAC